MTAAEAGLAAALLPAVLVAKATKRYRLAGNVTAYCFGSPGAPGTKVKRSRPPVMAVPGPVTVMFPVPAVGTPTTRKPVVTEQSDKRGVGVTSTTILEPDWAALGATVRAQGSLCGVVTNALGALRAPRPAELTAAARKR